MKHHTASGRISFLPDPGTGIVERPQIPVLMREGEGSALAWDHESSVLTARPALLCHLRMRKAPVLLLLLLCCTASLELWLSAG